MSGANGAGAARQVLLPGATLGVLGGGQLGRMFAFAALRLGYRVHVLTDAAGSPAAQVAQSATVASYDDVDAVSRFAAGVDALTLEFENVSSLAVESAQQHTVVRPGVEALAATQNRGREKAFLARHGFPHVPFEQASEAGDLEAAFSALGAPCVVKSAGFGYDGKGQVVVTGPEDLAPAAALAKTGPVVVEQLVELAAELSVVAARSYRGEIVRQGWRGRCGRGVLSSSRLRSSRRQRRWRAPSWRSSSWWEWRVWSSSSPVPAACSSTRWRRALTTPAT